VVGQQITVNNIPVTVIGVAQNGFLGSFLGVSTAAWLPHDARHPGGRLGAAAKAVGQLIRIAPEVFNRDRRVVAAIGASSNSGI